MSQIHASAPKIEASQTSIPPGQVDPRPTTAAAPSTQLPQCLSKTCARFTISRKMASKIALLCAAKRGDRHIYDHFLLNICLSFHEQVCPTNL